MIGKHLLTHLADTVASRECNETIRYYAADAASLSLYASPANCEVFKEQVPYKDLVAFMKSAKGRYSVANPMIIFYRLSLPGDFM